MKTTSQENREIMQLERKIDDLREQVSDALQSGTPDRSRLERRLLRAQEELRRIKSPYADGRKVAA